MALVYKVEGEYEDGSRERARAAVYDVLTRHGLDGKAEMVFRGIPDHSYTLQRSIDMIIWSDLATVTAGADGKILFVDSAPPMPQAFYRTRSN